MTMPLKVGTFTKSLLIHIGRESGRFIEAGLDVEEISVASSPAQFQSLAASELDIAITSPDNVLAYRFLTTNPLKRNFDVKILGAIDRGLGLSLCLSPYHQDIEQVQNPVFAVDVPQSGFAFVGYALLANSGLLPGHYKIESLGSTPKRAKALIAGECDATILNAGNEIYSASKNCTILSSVTDLGPYLGTVLAAIPDHSGEYRAGSTEFTAVLLEIVDDIKAGKLHSEVVTASSFLFGLTLSQGEEHYEVLRDNRNGLVSNGKVDRPSIETLIELRQRFLPTDELDSILSSLDELVLHESLLSDVTE